MLIGGIEASLRRVTHYDYWKNTLMPSILIDSGADFLLYGMGEQVVREVATSMHSGFNPKRIRAIRQVAYVADREHVERLDKSKTIFLNSFERCKADKRAFGENFVTVETESNLLQAENIIVDSFRCGINVFGGEIINDVVCVFWMVFVGVGV